LLSLQEIVCLSGFGEFLVHELVLSGERLDVLSQFGAFSGLDLYDLGLMVNLLPEALVFLPEELNFVFPFE
jgi:hypothetical protein